MTSEELVEIQARLDAAPKAPWTGDRNDGTVKYDVLANEIDEDGHKIVVIHGCNGNEDPSYGIRSDEAKRFILSAPTDIANLLAEVARLKNTINAVKRTLKDPRIAISEGVADGIIAGIEEMMAAEPDGPGTGRGYGGKS